jgi:hypothetical protein
MALLIALSKSTKVSAGQSRLRISSRVTTCPARQQQTENLGGLILQLQPDPMFAQFPRPAVQFENSKVINRTIPIGLRHAGSPDLEC